MDEIRELRLDLFCYFLLFSTHLPLWILTTVTIIFFMRMWWPNIVAEIEEEMNQDDKPIERATQYSEEMCDLIPQDVKKDL